MKNMKQRELVHVSCQQYSLFVEILVFVSCELVFVCFSCEVLNLLVCRDILTFATVVLSKELQYEIPCLEMCVMAWEVGLYACSKISGVVILYPSQTEALA